MDWNSLKFRIAVLTSLSVSLLLVLFGGYNYSTAKAQSTQGTRKKNLKRTLARFACFAVALFIMIGAVRHGT